MTFVSPKVLASWTPTIHPGDPNMIQIDFDSFGFEAFVASTVNWPEISVDSNACLPIKRAFMGHHRGTPKFACGLLFATLAQIWPKLAT